MTKIKTAPALLAVLALGLILTACKSTLEPGGAYAPTNAVPDKAFYITDGAFMIAAGTLDTAFKFEQQNRLTLWKLSPQIKHTLDKIRPDAAQAVLAYKATREAYKANPTPTGLDILNTVLAKLNQLSTAASAAVTNYPATPTK